MAVSAALAAISVMTMMTTNQGDGSDVLWLDKPGIVIRAPHHLSPARPIPLKIDVEAGMHTDDELGGNLIQAVSLVLVRQDRPGVFLGGAYNLHEIGYPEDFGLGDDRSSVLGLEHELPDPHPKHDPRDTSGEMVESMFGHGFVDRGSGRYFLLGGFAKWWAAPQTIHISDPAGPAPVDQRPVFVAAAAVAPPFVPPARPMLEIGELGGRHFLRVILPPSAPAHGSPPAKAAKPFFTIVGFHLQNRGGSVAGVFTPQLATGSTAGAIESTVSFKAFASFDPGRMNRREIPGSWVFLLFAGDQVSEPLTVTLSKSDY